MRSPLYQQFLAVLTARGIAAASDGADGVTVHGVPQDQIGQLAFDHGIVLYEIAAVSSDLEDVFLQLTAAEAA